MRLHHLTVSAFGPFAGTVEVDFDELSAAGLFLLTGATGAGKTSVLDAVCFALYGQVPGDRSGAKHLRSDHAAPQARPEVRLRLSIGERLFTFTRSPSWSRPKLRGVGETREQAHVHVEELRDGRWQTLTTRLDDAGLLVSNLLGMTCTQFTQVAMLPQGRFQAFLRASSAERHSVLQQLFRTDRFERVERWLVDRRGSARRASAASANAVLESVNRLREAAGEQDPPSWGDDLTAAADSGELAEWARRTTSRCRAEAQAAAADSAATDARLAAAASSLVEAERVARLRAQADAARATLESIAEQGPTLAEDRAAVADHHRAAPLAGLAASRRTAGQSRHDAHASWTAHADALGSVPGAPTRTSLAALRRDAHAAHTLALAHQPRSEAAERARTRSARIRTQLQGLEASVAELDVALTELPAEIADAVAAVREAQAAAARHPVVLAQARRLSDLIDAARRAEVVDLELSAARTDVIAAIELAQQTREHYLDVREARIDGMAGELAAQLAVGCSCPVCGSAEHPAPAVRDRGAVSRSDEDAARKVHEDAAFEVQAREVALTGLEAELSSLTARLAGVARPELPADLAAATEEEERLQPLVAALEVLMAREQDCRSRRAQAEAERAEALLERAALTAERKALEALVGEVEKERRALLDVPGAGPDEQPEDDLATLVDRRSRYAAGLDAALAALDGLGEAERRVGQLDAEMAGAAAAAGFDGPAEALAALLGEDQVGMRTDRLRQAAADLDQAHRVLADPAVAAAAEAPVPDLAGLRSDAADAESAARAAAAARLGAEGRADRVGALGDEITARLAAWAPRRADHQLAAALAALVEGKSADNPLRMRLAAYVLAERLRQVVAAANERLAQMSDQRYTLEHSDDRGYGEQRGGLSLRVRDGWTGEHRDPATLSGGETFVVSLALALGLADTVAHEAGGTDIDTLFIDEGFGSLDADTLEDVMDTLDSLRDGGRVVGLVSHVPELRSRIPTQLEVSKGRAGSTIRAVLSGS